MYSLWWLSFFETLFSTSIKSNYVINFLLFTVCQLPPVLYPNSALARPVTVGSHDCPANVVSTLLLVDMVSRRRTTSNQRWNNVAYVNVEIYNVEQRQIKVVHFNVDLNNFRQRRNNVVIFNVDFNNVQKRWNNVVNMTICKIYICLNSKTK